MAYENRRMSGSVYGNAVREAVPEKSDREVRREKREYVRNVQTQVESRVAAKVKADRSYTFLQTVVLAAAICTAMVMCLFYIQQLSENREIRASIGRLEVQYNTLRENNGLLENEEDARIDYDAVYAYATETLGMQNPEKQQMVVYEAKASEYVRNSGVIPHD